MQKMVEKAPQEILLASKVRLLIGEMDVVVCSAILLIYGVGAVISMCAENGVSFLLKTAVIILKNSNSFDYLLEHDTS